MCVFEALYGCCCLDCLPPACAADDDDAAAAELDCAAAAELNSLRSSSDGTDIAPPDELCSNL